MLAVKVSYQIFLYYLIIWNLDGIKISRIGIRIELNVGIANNLKKTNNS